MAHEAPRALRIYDERDLPWIADLLDVVEASAGESWHALVECVEHAALRVHPSHRAAMLQALRRVLGGDGRRARLARRARTLMHGPPARDAAEHRARLATAAATLGTTPDDVESLLWADLAIDRPVVLTEGRPAEIELAAFANLERIQRCVRRAHELELRLWGEVDDLVRSIARHALIEQIRRDGDATVIDMTGPLALCHSTFVYGRALAQLVPLLGGPSRFALDVQCRIDGEPARLQVASPVWLPPPGAAWLRPGAAWPTPSAVDRLAEDLEALGLCVDRAPPPIASGEHLLFPDLAVAWSEPSRCVGILPGAREQASEGRAAPPAPGDRPRCGTPGGGVRWLIEVIGFATGDSLTTKLARYRAAGIDGVVLCADTAASPGCDLAPRICGFTREVDIDDLLAAMAAAP